MAGEAASSDRVIVLFDGVCNVCDATVRFVAERDPKGRFAFASLQSEAGRAWLRRAGLPVDALETLVVVDGTRVFLRSSGTARILRGLRGAWPLLGWLLWLVPRPLRDRAYAAFAARRYAWFGQRESCAVPTPELRARFL